MPGERSSHLSHLQGAKLGRRLLKEQAAERLRTLVTRGRIPEGTRLTEREVSEVMGVSRTSAHEALTILEAEGLVESRPDGRYVTELTEARVRYLHEVRILLERLAVGCAAMNTSPQHEQELLARLEDFKTDVASGDHVHIAESDLELHRAIWAQAENLYLIKLLESMSGVMLVLAARARLYFDPPSDRVDPEQAGVYVEHRELVELIGAGKKAEAADFIEEQLTSAQRFALATFRLHVDDPGGPA